MAQDNKKTLAYNIEAGSIWIRKRSPGKVSVHSSIFLPEIHGRRAWRLRLQVSGLLIILAGFQQI